MSQITVIIEKIIKNVEKRISNIEKKLEECRTFEQVRNKGELLKNAENFRKGMSSIETTDYFSKDLKQIIIETEPAFDRFKNAEKYFKKARKFEKGIPYQEKRLAQAEKLLKSVKGIGNRTAKEEIDIDSAVIEFKDLGFSRFFKTFNKPKERKERKSLLREFTSTDGFTVYAGKSAEENDYLTFNVASGKDIWMHAAGFKGSHVVIKIEKGKQVQKRTLKEAAALAVYYSKARGRFRTEVTYTFAHNVRRASRRAPGKVTASNPKYITPDKKALDDIMEKENG